MDKVIGSVFSVSFETSWENEELIEKNTLTVVADDAEHAIEKAKFLNKEETYTDEMENKTFHRDHFALLEVTHVTDLDG